MPEIHTRMLFMFFYIFGILTRANYALGHQDYCEREHFQPECPKDHVILMEQAHYGRMEPNRCITSSHGYLNCYINVLNTLRRLCSGQPSCSVPVASIVEEHDQPCPKDFRSYLQANYSCVPVTVPSQSNCRSGTVLHFVTSPTGYLSSYIASAHEQGPGTFDCPWVLRVPRGQRLKITLLDFSPVVSLPGGCQVYATIKENPGGYATTVCGGKAYQTEVYTSTGAEIEVRITKNNRKSGEFLLQYETLGCPEIIAPQNGMVEQTKTQAIIHCHDNNNRWTLNCEENKWKGKSGNCTIDLSSQSTSKGWPETLPYGFSVLVIICIAVCIAVSVLVIGLVCIHKRRLYNRQQYLHKHSIPYGTNERPSLYDDAYHRQHPFSPHDKMPSSPLDNIQPAHLDNHPLGSTNNDYRPPSYDLHRGGYRSQRSFHHPPQPHLQITVPSSLPASSGLADYDGSFEDRRFVDHVYESPKFERAHPGEDLKFQFPETVDNQSNLSERNKNKYVHPVITPPAQYFELDPEVTPSNQNTQSN